MEAEVGIGRFSPRLRDKNAHFPEEINIKELRFLLRSNDVVLAV